VCVPSICFLEFFNYGTTSTRATPVFFVYLCNFSTMAVPRLCLERWQSTTRVLRGSVTVATVATVEKPFFRIKSDFFYFFHFSHCFSMIFFYFDLLSKINKTTMATVATVAKPYNSILTDCHRYATVTLKCHRC
jgi:hypothetical protein